MKVGTSLSRCVLDIYNDEVSIDEVMVIVSRTDFDPEIDDQWKNVWSGYAGGNSVGSLWSAPAWQDIPPEDEVKIRDICIKLKKYGKLHQPRKFGAFPNNLKDHWYDLVPVDETILSNPAVKKAWDQYRLIAGLS